MTISDIVSLVRDGKLTWKGSFMEIHEGEVYTPQEAQKILKVSQSTFARMLKSGLLNAAKVGKQYRIMGKELLRILSPKLEDKVGKIYNKGRHWIHDEPIDPQSQKTPKPPAQS